MMFHHRLSRVRCIPEFRRDASGRCPVEQQRQQARRHRRRHQAIPTLDDTASGDTSIGRHLHRPVPGSTDPPAETSRSAPSQVTRGNRCRLEWPRPVLSNERTALSGRTARADTVSLVRMGAMACAASSKPTRVAASHLRNGIAHGRRRGTCCARSGTARRCRHTSRTIVDPYGFALRQVPYDPLLTKNFPSSENEASGPCEPVRNRLEII